MCYEISVKVNSWRCTDGAKVVELTDGWMYLSMCAQSFSLNFTFLDFIRLSVFRLCLAVSKLIPNTANPPSCRFLKLKVRDEKDFCDMYLLYG